MHPTKWYHRIAFHLFSLAGVNSFVIYRQLRDTGLLLDFLTDICRSLLLGQNNGNENENIIPAKKVRSLKASEVPVSVSFDSIGHWPIKFTTNWCKLGLPLDDCSSRTKFICAKYRVYLWQMVVKNVFWTFMELTDGYILYFSKHEILYLWFCFKKIFSFFVCLFLLLVMYIFIIYTKIITLISRLHIKPMMILC